MATSYKLLGQVNPLANTDTTLYTVPAATSALISSIVVCNQVGGTGVTYRVAVRPGGATLAVKHYIIFDSQVANSAPTTQTQTLGLTLAAGDVITVRASTANFSFQCFGVELT